MNLYIRRRRLYSSLAAIVLSIVVSLFMISAVYASAEVSEDTSTAQSKAAKWLVEMHQNDDGGYSSFSAGANLAASDIAGTLDALLALGPAGGNTEAAVGFLTNHADDLAAFAGQGGGMAGKSVLALVAADLDPTDFEGHDLVELLSNQLGSDGRYNVETAFDQSLAIIALAAASQPVPTEATDWLLSIQSTDGEGAGSWDDGFGTSANSDATAVAIIALLDSGLDAGDDQVASARGFLAGAQLPSGGWEYGIGFGENANSTSLSIQALTTLGEDITSPDSSWQPEGTLPMASLLAWQGDSGAFQVDFGEGRFDDFFATVQSVPALATDRDANNEGGFDIATLIVIGGLAAVIIVGAVLLFGRQQSKQS